MSDAKEHWESIYRTKDYTQVGWYQESPEISLAILSKINATPSQSIIDVGCGASVLADNLILQGYNDITLVDLSEKALTTIRSRLGKKGDIPRYLTDDITKEKDLGKLFDIWHDRAVFHFLTDKMDRNTYMANLQHSLSASGHAIIGTFSLKGPSQCSGLDVVQYDEEKMKRELPEKLHLLESIESTHVVPNGAKQEYMYFIIQQLTS